MFELIPFDRGRRGLSLFRPFAGLDEMEKNFFKGFSFADFKTDIRDNGDSYLLEADLPGFKKEDIKIDIDGSYLKISAERRCENEEKDSKGNFVKCERSYGSFSRSFDITGIKPEAITAEYSDGVLKLTMPKVEEEIPTSRRLEIK